MLLKILGFITILFLIWFFFFKKPSLDKKPPRSKKPPEGETMVECHQCGTFVSASEALIQEGRYYCSQECVKEVR